MNTSFISAGTKAFTPINKVLQEVKVEMVFFMAQENEEGEKHFVCTGYKVAFNNTTMDLTPGTHFYANEECFKSGDWISKNNSLPWQLTQRQWYYDGMKAAPYHAWEHIKSFYLSPRGVFTITDGFYPELYSEKEEVYAYNDFRIAYEDGRTEVREGYFKPLLLNDEQKALKAEFEALAERMREAHMTMMFDENEDIYFVNNTRLSWKRDHKYYNALLSESQKANTKLSVWYVCGGGEFPITTE